MSAPLAAAGGAAPGRTEPEAGAADRAPVAAIVLAFNEEHNLPACLESLAGWVSQLFVVDSGSTDRTVEIARQHGAVVSTHRFESYGAQRNWALDHCGVTAPWVLNIDADERVTPELRNAISHALAGGAAGISGFLVSRRTVFMGRWIRHGGHYPAWHLRLFRTGHGRCEERLYDQHFYCDGATAHLAGDLVDTLTPDIATFSHRHVRWAHAEADEQLGVAPERARVRGRVRSGNAIEYRRWLRERYDRLPLFVRPVLYFAYRYFLRLGFLDGREGLIFHFLQGFWYRFLVDAVIFERNRRAARSQASGPGERTRAAVSRGGEEAATARPPVAPRPAP